MAFKRSAVRSRLSPPGRLAQLVAHPLDVREVTSSSLVSSTTKNRPKKACFLFSLYFSEKPADPPPAAAGGKGRGLFLKALPGLFSAVPNNSVLLQTLLQAKIIRPDRLRAGSLISSCTRPGYPRSSAPGLCPDRTLPGRRSVSLCRDRLRPSRLSVFAGTTWAPERPSGRSSR